MKKPEKFWDFISGVFAKKPMDDEQLFGETVLYIKQHLHPNSVVLDCGCGTGTLSNAISDNVQKINAIDISGKMLNIAKARSLSLNKNNIEYLQTSIYDNTFKENTFDIIFAFNVFHFIEDSNRFLTRVSELLTPNGIFISSTPCLRESRRFSSEFMNVLSKLGVIPKIKMLTFFELEKLISKAPFEILDKKTNSEIPRDYIILAKSV